MALLKYKENECSCLIKVNNITVVSLAYKW